MEYHHHGDALVPRQQRFGSYTRAIVKKFRIPIENQYGLRPATIKGTIEIGPLRMNADLDKRGFLNGVTTFMFHKHCPLCCYPEGRKERPRAGHQADRSFRAHPITETGNREFNSLIWLPPAGK